ncbi:Crystal protein ET79 [Mycena venus]|uniref:Crystal protein ET79 n=1 Tax=Mycena venus TaxID=2733690 RepID=A0A8H7CEM5_9AGAR|nr:Crystal protein ET79 [Mycena venus]
MSPSRSVTVKFTNNSGGIVTRSSASLAGGVWTTNQYPPDTISAGATGSWESESDGLWTGTEGTVVYTLPGAAITIYWNNPQVGSNDYSITIAGAEAASYKGSHTGGDGNNATVNFTLAKA